MKRLIYTPFYLQASFTPPKQPADAEQFAEEMRWAKENNDVENAHYEMDNLMCLKLRQLGYGDAVDVFEQAKKKWYA